MKPAGTAAWSGWLSRNVGQLIRGQVNVDAPAEEIDRALAEDTRLNQY